MEGRGWDDLLGKNDPLAAQTSGVPAFGAK
jgi:hypothetical protein